MLKEGIQYTGSSDPDPAMYANVCLSFTQIFQKLLWKEQFVQLNPFSLTLQNIIMAYFRIFSKYFSINLMIQQILVLEKNLLSDYLVTDWSNINQWLNHTSNGFMTLEMWKITTYTN